MIRKKDIVRFVKARRISWIGHAERMEESRMPKRVMRKKIYTKRRRGRPKVRWLDDVQEDLRAMRIGWRGKAQDRDLWRRTAQEAKAQEGLQSQVVVAGGTSTCTAVLGRFSNSVDSEKVATALQDKPFQ
jgi:hypothetical protein